jgi:hypothetical protein
MDVKVVCDTKVGEELIDKMDFGKAVPKNVINKAIRQELTTVRKKVVSSARSSMANDPAKARNAVRKQVYKTVFGGYVTILTSRKVAMTGLGRDMHWKKGGRSGITRKRNISERTRMMRAYLGKDRQFILRWKDKGTQSRMSRYGNRGSVTGKNFFKSSSTSAMNDAAQRIGGRIVSLIQKAAQK